MPSFWNWLCFNKKRYITDESREDKSKQKLVKGKRKREADDEGSDSVKLHKKRLLDTSFGENESGSIGSSQDQRNKVDSSAQRLIAKPRSRKRRKVVDIFKKDTTREFHWPSEVHVPTIQQKAAQPSTFPNNSSNSFDAFRSNSYHEANSRPVENPPGLIPHNSYHAGVIPHNNSYHVDSMYGYVPKATQNIYASTALQGQKIDDYFADCRLDNALPKFAPPDRVRSRAFPASPGFPTNDTRQGTDKEALLQHSARNGSSPSGSARDFFLWQDSTSKRHSSTPSRQQSFTSANEIRLRPTNQSLLQSPVREVRQTNRMSIENMWRGSGEVLY